MSQDLVATNWPSIVQMAEAIAKSSLVPEAYRGKPNDIAVAALWGQEIGLGPMAAVNYIDVIQGSPGLNAEGSVALVRKAGHSITGNVTDTEASATGKRRDNGDEMTVTFSMKDARDANLANKAVWKQYPRSMMWSRAVKQLCRQLFSDVLMGLSYSPEEIESFSNGAKPTGSGVDVTTAHSVESLPVDPNARAELAPVVPVTEDGELIEPKRSTRRPPPGRRPALSSETSEPAESRDVTAPADEAGAAPSSPPSEAPPAVPAPLASTTERAALRERLNALEGKARSVFRETYGELNDLLAKDVGKASDFIAEYEKGGAG